MTGATLSHEVAAVQNPALGALLLWRCASAHTLVHQQGAAIPLPLLFIVLPVVLHHQTAELLQSTQRASGLRKFIEKFKLASQGKTDLLVAIAPRAVRMRELSAQSLGLAVLSRLISIDPETASAMPVSTTPALVGVPPSIRPMLGSAEKLGHWFAAVSLYEVGHLLQVRL